MPPVMRKGHGESMEQAARARGISGIVINDDMQRRVVTQCEF